MKQKENECLIRFYWSTILLPFEMQGKPPNIYQIQKRIVYNQGTVYRHTLLYHVVMGWIQNSLHAAHVIWVSRVLLNKKTVSYCKDSKSNSPKRLCTCCPHACAPIHISHLPSLSQVCVVLIVRSFSSEMAFTLYLNPSIMAKLQMCYNYFRPAIIYTSTVLVI